ncbi:MAG: flagellin [Lachnospiraceae bacterium]
MRITNNMITGNTKSNINGNKIFVDKYNTQMTTQKKISKASEDPVIAIRALRLGTSLSHINQYVDNNIPDAEAWLDVTYTALNNMYTLISDIRTQCVNGSTDTLSTDDRQTILKSLQSLSEQVYTEGNADYSGRTIFTGYRTSSNLTFDTDEADTTYQIEQSFSYQDLETKRYYTGDVEVPVTIGDACTTTIQEDSYDRIRLGYDSVSKVDAFSYSYYDENGKEQVIKQDVITFETEADWEADQITTPSGVKQVKPDQVVFIKETGEFIFGENVAQIMKSNHANIDVTYTKTGFEAGELRPEYYYNCTDKSDPYNQDNWVTYTKEDQQISYTIAASTTLTVNTQASDVFDTSIQRDTKEMINIVQKSLNAEAKVEQIKQMMEEEKYSSPEDQEKLQTYLDAAQKELDYANDNLQKTYEQYITNFDNYMTQINTAITNVGSMQNRLSMTKNRVENQQMTIKELKSSNEDREISDILIDYTAAYNAYQASLTAAAKIGDQTLLNYL